ncbi:hypothetical protein BJ138DRAFT_1154080 [Hygrophoropsis aurantiaca]|uniref:Uncharacterized protein n=1 Tax=Hygrophoropsis aurantiaca TaxID=72124 RepID=A0ACB8A9P2_9AGAM|nr:hypothetical protein BJ138DRAFT_1154080 [Hygrophoropsis aurantiaca]
MMTSTCSERNGLPQPCTATMSLYLTSNSISALTLLCWEVCVTLDDEVELIWNRESNFIIKWIFLLTRYAGIVSLIGFLFSEDAKTHLMLSCRDFLVMQVTMCQILVTLVELTFAIRVFALYNRDRRMALFLACLIAAGFIVMVFALSRDIPRTTFDANCGVTHIDPSMAWFSLTSTATEIIVLLLTLVKCMWTVHLIQKSAPIFTLLVRDGSLGFLAIVSFLIPTSILLVVQHGRFVSWVSPWLNVAMSSAACRLIINMLRLPLNDSQNLSTRTSPIITSHIVM